MKANFALCHALSFPYSGHTKARQQQQQPNRSVSSSFEGTLRLYSHWLLHNQYALISGWRNWRWCLLCCSDHALAFQQTQAPVNTRSSAQWFAVLESLWWYKRTKPFLLASQTVLFGVIFQTSRPVKWTYRHQKVFTLLFFFSFFTLKCFSSSLSH